MFLWVLMNSHTPRQRRIDRKRAARMADREAAVQSDDLDVSARLVMMARRP